MDWINFFESNNIYYATSGHNVSKGNCVLRCPWCGHADESQHLVVNLEGKGFKCWRDRSHSGKNPAKLIQALLGCSWEQADSIAGNAKTLPNDFMSKLRSTIDRQEPSIKPNNLKLPVEFRDFSKLPSCKMYLQYINSRGFTIKDTEEYNVYFASQGLYKGRIIFTVMYKGKLCGWTGRTIYPMETVRYKTLTNDVEKAKENGETPAPAPISDFLLFYDRLVNTNANTIVLCEGPFDAWKVNVIGSYIGVAATCFFTSSLSKAQLNLLHGLLLKFKNRYLLLDQGTFSKAERIRSDLASLDVVVRHLSQAFKDPAEIQNAKQLKEMLAIV